MKNNENNGRKRNKIIIIVLIIIILLLLIFWLGYRVGKIGYQETVATVEDTSNNNAIIITEDDMQGIKNNQLNIFKNEKFNNEKIIAPHSKGTYKFYIKNETDSDIIYDIQFSDEMNNFVNMKYKLKLDNVYIKGNTDNYLTLDQINLNDIVVLKNSTNSYTLEWYWEDNDILDTSTGSQDGDNYYKLNLNINSSEYRQ